MAHKINNLQDEPKSKICLDCGKEKPISAFGHATNIQIQKSGKCVIRRKNICYTCFSVRQNARIKLEMLAAFDWKCQCCGELHPDFLTLQHITGLGKTPGKRASKKEKWFAKKHGWNKDHFAVLCYNCNCAKQYFGRCPHEIGETPEQGIEILKKMGEPKRYYTSDRWGANRCNVEQVLAEIEVANEQRKRKQ
ncbi:MAG TPA: hypothetical protein VH187_18680 [Scandinavium sp.]|jgi:hypothetical protein|uniref:hypothetical protein n=1 Tax=Scandinavium sp. TaxID=2830653 RepID=UPI002E300702|nr:hypothetical protein [Scandinavium sp.]HEX4503164.1 hypothetical protein [Scandinavium sp.]